MYTLNKLATILDTESQSNIIDTEMHALCALQIPDAIDGTVMTFLGSAEANGDFSPVVDDAGNDIEVAIDVGLMVGITGSKAEALAPIRYLKLQTGTHAAPDAQTADRTVIVVLK